MTDRPSGQRQNRRNRGDQAVAVAPGDHGRLVNPDEIDDQLPAPPLRPRAAQGGVRPVAANARLKRRHSSLFMSFVVVVLIPLAVIAAYLHIFAQDQYASNTGFTVRSDEGASASELMGGLSALVGGGGSSDTDVLYAFIHSQQIVRRVQDQLDLRTHYAQFWDTDPVFSIWPDATIEDLLWFWTRVVIVSYDKNSGLMDVQVRAHTAEYAQSVARMIVAESEAMINALNETARRDSMSNAERDLEDALVRLRTARENMAAFRARTQIVDPQADIAGRMGVINGLQQSLAQALVDYDLLLQTTPENDPRLRQAERRIEVIRQRIREERVNFATQDVTVFDTDYPRLIAQFEAHMVDQEFAERTYTAALEALDVARSNAARQQLYLATYIRPTLAERAEYPQRTTLILLSAGFLLLAWGVMALIYYSLRDRT
ncbi:MAG: sugar transporter [Pararhodobacter sp.]